MKAIGIKLDVGNVGLGMVLKDYQEVAMKHLWKLNGKGASSRDVWTAVNKEMPKKDGRNAISRASIINFLNEMVDNKVINYTEITGKGGHRRIYSVKYTEPEFKEWVVTTVLKALQRGFGAETKAAISSFFG